MNSSMGSSVNDGFCHPAGWWWIHSYRADNAAGFRFDFRLPSADNNPTGYVASKGLRQDDGLGEHNFVLREFCAISGLLDSL